MPARSREVGAIFCEPEGAVLLCRCARAQHRPQASRDLLALSRAFVTPSRVCRIVIWYMYENLKTLYTWLWDAPRTLDDPDTQADCWGPSVAHYRDGASYLRRQKSCRLQ